MISAQDAHDFCIAAVQVIPTLLIAFFVVDRIIKPPSTHVPEERRPTLDELRNKLRKDRERVQSVHSKLIKRRPRVRLLQPKRWDAWEKQRKLIEDLTKETADNEAELEKIEESIRFADEEYRTTLAINYRAYANLLYFNMISGIVGEIAAILGSLRQFDYRSTAVASAGSILVILSSLAHHAWHRLFPDKISIGKGDQQLAKIYKLGIYTFPLPASIGLILLANVLYGGKAASTGTDPARNSTSGHPTTVSSTVNPTRSALPSSAAGR